MESKEEKNQKYWHDIQAELAKIKTSISLMHDSSEQEIKKEYLPILRGAVEKLETQLKRKAKN